MKTNFYAAACLRVGLAALTLCLPSASKAQYAYDITPIAGLPTGLNNQGQAVGTYNAVQMRQYRSFEYSNGQTQDLFPADPNGSSASAINDKGQITVDGPNGPSVYNSATGVRTSLGLTVNDYANAINQNGVVAGTYHGAGPTHAYTYTSSTSQFQDINQIGGRSGYSTATAINNLGQVTGNAIVGPLSSAHLDAYLYSNGVAQDLGSVPGYIGSEGTGINDSGEVIGYADAGGNTPTHAFLYSGGKMNDLGVLINPQADSFAFGINSAGDVVGASASSGFLYHNGKAQYLNDLIDPSLGWNITSAAALNDRGQIIGSGNLGGFIMTPHLAATPAPGSLLTFGGGMGALLLVLRRRKRTAASR